MKNLSADKRGRVRSLWQPNRVADLSDVTVPVHLAFCVIVSCTRHHVGTKSSGLVILEVPDADAVESFVQAGRILLRKVLAHRDRSDPFVRSLGNKRDKLSEYEIFRRAAEDGSGILFCTDLDEVSEELKFFADLTATIPRPNKRQIRATFRRFHREPADAEVDLVERESWAHLIYAFPPDRPIVKGLRRLREFSQIVESAERVAKQSLECLHGYGAAREWGLELARDIRDYKNGLIAWDDVDAGLLLSGPPGTGKTLFAEALANTCQIPIVVTSAAEWQAAGYLSDLLKAMRAAFAEAAAKAPCLLFLDEVDSFGSRAIADSQNAD